MRSKGVARSPTSQRPTLAATTRGNWVRTRINKPSHVAGTACAAGNSARRKLSPALSLARIHASVKPRSHSRSMTERRPNRSIRKPSSPTTHDHGFTSIPSGCSVRKPSAVAARQTRPESCGSLSFISSSIESPSWNLQSAALATARTAAASTSAWSSRCHVVVAWDSHTVAPTLGPAALGGYEYP